MQDFTHNEMHHCMQVRVHGGMHNEVHSGAHDDTRTSTQNGVHESIQDGLEGGAQGGMLSGARIVVQNGTGPHAQGRAEARYNVHNATQQHMQGARRTGGTGIHSEPCLEADRCRQQGLRPTCLSMSSDTTCASPKTTRPTIQYICLAPMGQRMGSQEIVPTLRLVFASQHRFPD